MLYVFYRENSILFFSSISRLRAGPNRRKEKYDGIRKFSIADHWPWHRFPSDTLRTVPKLTHDALQVQKSRPLNFN